MSSVSNDRKRYIPKLNEICIGNIASNTEPNHLLNYFGKFGSIIHYSFTSSTGGYVFISYKDPSMVDECMNFRPHYVNGRRLYVKRALPVDDEHPRERFETTRDLMIVVDFEDKIHDENQFLSDLRQYFSSYGRMYACKYCYEKNFKYILLEFADKDQVDRIILDKPHYYNEHQLDVMKFIESNIDIVNKRSAMKNQKCSTIVKDAIDDDSYDYNKSQNNFQRSVASVKEPINEDDLKAEVFRLQDILRKMNEEFSIKRKQLEDECTDQLKQFNADIAQTTRSPKELEEEHAKLLAEYESLKQENEALNEQYLAVELENFEMTSYYEQILAEEQAKTLQLEIEYAQKSKTFNTKPLSSSSSPIFTNSVPSSTKSS